MKYIISHPKTKEQLRLWADDFDLLTPCFFFRKRPAGLLAKVEDLMRSLLWQILDARPELISTILYEESGATGRLGDVSQPGPLRFWTEARLRTVLKQLFQQMPSDICLCVFIDGVDECDEEGIDQTAIADILLNCTSKVKLCVSSRPEQFNLNVYHAPQLVMQESTHGAIEKTVRDELMPELQYYYPQMTEHGLETLISSVSRGSEGIFLRVSLVVKELKRGIRRLDDYDLLYKRIRVLPHTIEDLYDHMLGSMETTYWEEASVYLQVVIASSSWHPRITLLHMAFTDSKIHKQSSKRDWTNYKMEDILAICQRLERRIHARCMGLIEVKKETNGEFLKHLTSSSPPETYVSLRSVQFIHRSVEDFIMDHGNEIFNSSEWISTSYRHVLDCGLGFMTLIPALFHEDNDFTG